MSAVVDPKSACVYDPALERLAASLLSAADQKRLRIVTVESCTGGALSALLTDVEGLSHAFERGFVVYTEAAKRECVGVSSEILERDGPVSKAAAVAMVQGALNRSGADIAVAITGNAGPSKDGEEGLVHLCAVVRGGACLHEIHHFGKRGRVGVRIAAIEAALGLAEQVVKAA